MRRTINATHHNRAIRVDNVHSEMMQTSPIIFARLLTKVWKLMESNEIIPSVWTQGIMFPLLKKGSQNRPENCKPLCKLSHVRKAIELAVLDELEEIVCTDVCSSASNVR